MGKHFGDLATIRGIVYYKLSPHEQKPYARALKFLIPNMFSRAASRILMWLPPFIIGYLTFTGVEAAHYQATRKDIKEFANEVDPEAAVKKTCKKKETPPC